MPSCHAFEFPDSFAGGLVGIFAHAGGDAGSLLSGFLHPILGPDHVLAMIAVGLWGAQLGKPSIWLLPVAFPLVMAIGGFLGLIGVPLPAVEIGIAVSAIVLGLMVLLDAQPPMAVSLIIVAVFAVFHGHAHGTELPEGQDGMLYSIGFVIGTGSLHGIGILIGLIHYWKWGKSAIRLAGLLVACGGAYFLWGAIG